ncbi:MAG: alkaline phosphatase family protein, partial [Pedobacter sp.]|nr:alkaline phosphatase family protein [Pedobacter sp.]
MMGLLKSGKDLDFLFAVFPSVDWDSHYHHIRDHRTIAAYQIADNSIGEVRAYLEKKGWWKNTLFMLTSDHGLTPSHTHFDLGDWMTEQGLKSVGYPVIWRQNPKSAVMISGNSFGSIHLLNHEGDHVLQEKELVDHFSKERMDELLKEKAVDFITYRGNKAGEYYVQNHHGKALISQHQDNYSYQPIDADPLCLKNITVKGHRAALESTFNSLYPDALVQITQLFKSRRAGDLVVSARNGYDLRDFWEYPEHKGSHGSLTKEHIHVPLIYNQKGWAEHAARTADIFPSILKWMDKPIPVNEGNALN